MMSSNKENNRKRESSNNDAPAAKKKQGVFADEKQTLGASSARGQLEQKAVRTDDMEDSLSCGICTDIFYHCVSLQPCMHCYCAHCYNSWLATSRDCPQCRKKVERISTNHIVNNLVDAFLKSNPDKKRPDKEKKYLDAKFRAMKHLLDCDLKRKKVVHVPSDDEEEEEEEDEEEEDEEVSSEEIVDSSDEEDSDGSYAVGGNTSNRQTSGRAVSHGQVSGGSGLIVVKIGESLCISGGTGGRPILVGAGGWLHVKGGTEGGTIVVETGGSATIDGGTGGGTVTVGTGATVRIGGGTAGGWVRVGTGGSLRIGGGTSGGAMTFDTGSSSWIGVRGTGVVKVGFAASVRFGDGR